MDFKTKNTADKRARRKKSSRCGDDRNKVAAGQGGTE
jgi:hypothetical protein